MRTALLACLFSIFGCEYIEDEVLNGLFITPRPQETQGRVNEYRYRATHNSYHLTPLVPMDKSHEYGHAPLNEQLDAGVRGFELDVHMELNGVLSVYHIALIDDVASCGSLEACLIIMRDWSIAHQNHAPIFVWIEAKYDTGGIMFDGDNVEDVVMEVMPPDMIVTPMQIRNKQWPLLNDARGKFFFVLLREDDLAAQYSHDYGDLSTRVMHVSTPERLWFSEFAAFAKVNNPTPEQMRKAKQNSIMVASNGCLAGMSVVDCADRLQRHQRLAVSMIFNDYSLNGDDDEIWPR